MAEGPLIRNIARAKLAQVFKTPELVKLFEDVLYGVGTILPEGLQQALAALQAHIGKAAGAHAASAISNAPAGDVTETTVQGAINELDTKKQDRAGLAAPTGSALVGHQDTTVSDLLDSVRIADYATLRAYTGSARNVYITGYSAASAPSGVAGQFTLDDTDTTSADNGGTILVASNGKRWKRVIDGHVNVLWFGAKGDGVTDDTTAIQNAANTVTGVAGRALHIPKTPTGVYLTGSVSLKSNTVVWIDGGVTIRKKVNGTRVFLFSNVSDVFVYANGATLDGQTSADSASSHTIYFDTATRCGLFDANVLGAGLNASLQGRDCIYIGGDSGTPSSYITVRGGSCANAKRNGISVVSGKHILVDGVEIYGTTGNPGAGIDIEANNFDKIEHVEVTRCKIHDNLTWGIVNVWGSHVHVHDNEIFDNGDAGFAASVGGAQFDASVVRSDVDIRAVTAVNSATGEFTITSGADLEVGTIVTLMTRGAGVRPSGATSGNCFVYSKSADNTKIILSQNGYSGVVSYASAGSGTLTSDPTTSELYFRCYVPGQSDHIDIHNNRCYGNGQVRGQIDILSSVNVSVWANELDAVVDKSGISFTYCRNVTAKENEIKGDISSTSATARGIHFGICTRGSTARNEIKNFSGPGLNYSGHMLPGTLADDNITNCGKNATYMVQLDNVKKAKLRGTRLRLDPAYPTTYGVIFNSNVAMSFLEQVDAEGAGNSNVNSLLLSGTGNKKINCIQYDGTLVNT